MNTKTNLPVDANHINTVRRHMIDQLAALRTVAPGEALDAELRRAKGVAELAQTIVNSAKVEIDYLEVTGQSSAPFLEVPPDTPYLSVTTGPGNGITSITRHQIKG